MCGFCNLLVGGLQCKNPSASRLGLGQIARGGGQIARVWSQLARGGGQITRVCGQFARGGGQIGRASFSFVVPAHGLFWAVPNFVLDLQRAF